MAERASSSDVARERAAFRDVAPGLVALVVLQGSLVILDPDGGATTANLVWSLLPLVPIGWLVWSQVRSLRRADEFQRMLQLEAMAIGFGGFVVAAMVGSLLDGAGISDARQLLQATFIAGILSWLVALVVLMRRAR